MAEDTKPPIPPELPSVFTMSDDAVEQALLDPERAAIFEAEFGPEQYAELRELARSTRSAVRRGGPRVLILPGVMGSRLGKPSLLFPGVLWLNPAAVALGQLTGLKLDASSAIKPVGVLLIAYLKIKLRLGLAGFDAEFYPYDWRRSVAELGDALAARLATEAKPPHLVVHSMGGLVARAALRKPGVNIGRLIMLGTPNYGSFSAVELFRATYDPVVKLALLDPFHSAADLVTQVFSTFPSVYEMLPFPSKFPAGDLYGLAGWPTTAPLPRAPMLGAARPVQDSLPPGDQRFYLIAGVNRDTVAGMRLENGKFIYTMTKEGDGTVLLKSTLLEGVPDSQIYYVEEEHGSLPNNGAVESAVADLLRSGTTQALPRSVPPARRDTREVGEDERRAAIEAAGRVDAREVLRAVAAPDAAVRAAPATEPVEQPAKFSQLLVARRRQHRLELRFALGSITQVDSRAYVLGIFKNVSPAGAALAIDRRLHGAISEFTARRMFSGGAGEVFALPVGRSNPMPADMVVFAGLGSFDTFAPDKTLQPVAENIVRVLIRTNVEEFATVLVGGGTGHSVRATIENLLIGFLRGLKDADREHRFRSITFCEMDEARMNEIKREILTLSSTDLFADTELLLDEYTLPPEPAMVAETRGRPRIAEPAYLLFRAEELDGGGIVFRSSVLGTSGRAALISGQCTGTDAALDDRLAELNDAVAAGNVEGMDQVGALLAQDILPATVRDALMKSRDSHLVVVHDATAARVPWETLRIGSGGAEGRAEGDGSWAPALEAGLSHRLHAENLPVANWLEGRRAEAGVNVLLVADPRDDLAGARKEAKRIAELAARTSRLNLTTLAGKQATVAAVLEELRSGRYDLVHYAGHAFFKPERRSDSGLLCSDGVLGGRDLEKVFNLPSLMFFNACESARLRKVKRSAEGAPTAGARQSARAPMERTIGLAETILRSGIANLLGTYWPVGDDAAEKFSEQFYSLLLEGATLGEAIQKGRAAVAGAGSVDWADYVFYGSYEFRLKLNE